MGKSISGVGVEDLVGAGLKIREAKEFERVLRYVVINGGLDTKEVLRLITARKLLKPWHPHYLHQLIHYSLYYDYDESIHGPPLYWFLSPHESRRTNLGLLMESHGSRILGSLYKDLVISFTQLQQYSVQHPEIYWPIILKELSIEFSVPPKRIMDTSKKFKHGGTWLPGSVLNIANCCLHPRNLWKEQDNSFAIVWRTEGYNDLNVEHLTLKELRKQVMLVANATFRKGDCIAIDMSMTAFAVIIYLAIVFAGFVVVSIGDSFAPKEIATRCVYPRRK